MSSHRLSRKALFSVPNSESRRPRCGQNTVWRRDMKSVTNNPGSFGARWFSEWCPSDPSYAFHDTLQHVAASRMCCQFLSRFPNWIPRGAGTSESMLLGKLQTPFPFFTSLLASLGIWLKNSKVLQDYKISSGNNKNVKQFIAVDATIKHQCDTQMWRFIIMTACILVSWRSALSCKGYPKKL